jgi:ATP-dependent Clp protease ATP-binding subunit ClpA
VKRYLQKHIETELASMIIRGDVVDESRVVIDSGQEGLTFSVQ